MFNYCGCVGYLIYLSGGTRYNITLSVYRLTKYAMEPGVKQFEVLMHLVGYLDRNLNMAISFYHKLDNSPVAEIIHMIHKPHKTPTIVTF